MSVLPLVDQWRKTELLVQRQPDDLRNALADLQDWMAGWVPQGPSKLANARQEAVRTHRFWQIPKVAVAGSSDKSWMTAGGLSLNIRELCPISDDRDATSSILYLHGGGWTLGSNDTHDNWCRMLSNGTRSIVTMIEYPKAPEHGFQDICATVLEAIRAFRRNARGQGQSVFVVGDSAGATLALLTCLALDRVDQPDGVGLLYGPYCPSMNLRSHRELAQAGSLTDERMAWFWGNFLGEGGEFPELFSHAHLNRLPPLFLTCGGLDLLLDDTLDLAEALTIADRDVSMVIVPEMPHGFLQMVQHVAEARLAAQRFYDWIGAIRESSRPRPH